MSRFRSTFRLYLYESTNPSMWTGSSGVRPDARQLDLFHMDTLSSELRSAILHHGSFPPKSCHQGVIVISIGPNINCNVVSQLLTKL